MTKGLEVRHAEADQIIACLIAKAQAHFRRPGGELDPVCNEILVTRQMKELQLISHLFLFHLDCLWRLNKRADRDDKGAKLDINCAVAQVQSDAELPRNE